METKWNVRFDAWEFEWSQHDTETDSVKFYVEHDRPITDAEKQKIVAAMMNAAAVELIHIFRQEKNG